MNDMSCFRQFRTPLACSKFSFVLLPRFSLLALSSAIEPLRHANNVLGRPHFSWTIFSEDGAEIESSSRIPVRPAGGVADVPLDGTVILVGGADIASFSSRRMLSWIRRAATRVPVLGGLCTATHVLAEAGVLDGHSATVHWELAESMKEKFPAVRVTDGLFEIDRNRLTCAGETASTDLMLHLLADWQGKAVAASVSAQVLHGRPRLAVEPQAPLAIRTGTRNRHLLHAISLMEEHQDELLGIEEIARQAGCSRRQLERLFSSKTGQAPIMYYRNLRLDRARRFIFETQMTLTEIAVASGFSTGSSFSAAYKRRFGLTPTDEERQRRGPACITGNLLSKRAKGGAAISEWFLAHRA
jgi:transcriptional regulator GlxA family with amidase domain